MQLAIVTAILAAAIIYAAFRIHKALTGKGGRCTGCPLEEKCRKGKLRVKDNSPHPASPRGGVERQEL